MKPGLGSYQGEIADNIILAHELVKTYSRKHVSPRCMIKIDLQKAYDSVKWIYLEQDMMELVFLVHLVIYCMGNGMCVDCESHCYDQWRANTPFDAARGLRQGDPISPFLFAIATEYLSRKLNELKENKNFNYHPRCAKSGVTHLCFADDLLLFARSDQASIAAVHHCFLEFSSASGLQANLSKRSVYLRGVSLEEKERILQQLGFVYGELPFKYLGIPLATKKMSFIIPSKVLKAVDSYCRSYVWSGSNVISKKALVAYVHLNLLVD